jgi:hypothetical protein
VAIELPARADDSLLESMAAVQEEEAEARAALDVQVPLVESNGTVTSLASELADAEGCSFAEVKWVRRVSTS